MTTLHPNAPYLRIRPGRSGIDVREAWRFRDVLVTLGLRDITLRYRQTALGVLWVVLQPLLAAGIFSIVFGLLAGLSSDGLPYFLFAFAGTLAWSGFQTTFSKSSLCLVANAQLVSKVYFPRVLMPLSTLFSAAIDFAVGLLVLAALLAWYGIAPPGQILLLPLWFTGLCLLAVGLGLFTSSLAVSYRDVAHVLPVLTQSLFFASPVAYGFSEIRQHSSAVQWFFTLNPLSGYLEAFRWSVFSTPIAWPSVAYSIAFTAVVVVSGAIFFGRTERKFADVI